ncbi:MAG: hypothetical protein Q4A41_01015 [Bacillota bacterium]|nr:hypothetical protein [Bacillota bacterium]
MVREYEGKEYIIFDLVRFLDVKSQGHDPLRFAHSMMTHELSHICIHEAVPYLNPDALEISPYRYDLSYLVFDEGFAHFLSLDEDAAQYDFRAMLDKNHKESLRLLREAYRETDPVKQRKYLEEANSGSFQFGSLCGLLYLAVCREKLAEIFREGPLHMMEGILNQM